MDYIIRTSLQLSSALKNRRKMLNLTQKDAAFIVGLLPKTVSLLENTPFQASVESLYKYIKALGFDMLLIPAFQDKNEENRVEW